MTTLSRDFLNLAGREASRYGGESIVFLRELLQNARDAGAGRVVIETGTEEGVELIRVTDDGRGMAQGHAQRFLLTLYASSKRGNTGAAGRFGVGFWSILRFEPSAILIRSRERGAESGWEILFDGRLTLVRHQSCEMAAGTVIELKRPAQDHDLGASAWELVRRDARHLRVKDHSDTLMAITVNGRQATEEMEAGEPGLFFRRPGIRGAVSLGSVPEVTLLAHGLRVRSAASVDDLLLRPGRRHSRPRPGLRSGLSPQVVIDSDRLAVLMDRGDVAQDRALDAVAQVIRSETRRLCGRELDRLAPRSVWGKIRDGVTARRAEIGLGILLLGVAALGIWGLKIAVGNRSESAAQATEGYPAAEPYADRSSLYGGPVTESIDGAGNAPRLLYRPPEQRPLMAAFRVLGLEEDGTPLKDGAPLRRADHWVGDPNSALDFEIDFVADGRLLRLPVPTGHSVEGRSVTLDGRGVDLYLTGDDEPVLRLKGPTAGRVEYRTASRAFEGTTPGRWPALPTAVADQADALRNLPPRRRIDEAIILVKSSFGSTKASASEGYFGSVYGAGGGDCDVVNSVLAAVLDRAGLPSRMAVGWIGAGGVPMPGLHAWVEVDVGAGRWVAADVTVPTSLPGGTGVPEAPEPGKRGLEARGESIMAPLPVAIALGVALVLGVGLAIAMWKHRSRREFSVSGDLDTGPLVESLVRDRDAWPGFSQARRRKLVPTLGSERRSLAEIEEAASHKTLFVADRPGEWVKRVDGMVLDGLNRAGRTAATAFGAFDLDHWAGVWRQSLGDSFGVEVEEALKRVGLKTQIRRANTVSDGCGTALVVDGGTRTLVVIGEADPEWKRACELRNGNQSEAVFRAADIVVGLLPGRGAAPGRVLARLALEALAERKGSSS